MTVDSAKVQLNTCLQFIMTGKSCFTCSDWRVIQQNYMRTKMF